MLLTSHAKDIGSVATQNYVALPSPPPFVINALGVTEVLVRKGSWEGTSL